MSNTTTITFPRLAELLKAELKLQALHDGGVDNWDWYSESGPDKEEMRAIDKSAKDGTLTAGDASDSWEEYIDDDDSVDDSERTDEDDSVHGKDEVDW